MKRVSITEELAYGTALERLTGADRPVETPSRKAPAVPAGTRAKTAMIKLSVFLSREEDAYLESLASTAKFTGGKKLSKTKLIEAMVRAFRTTKLDVRGVRTEEELLKRVIAQLRK
ncbi:MAG TPA: hypothetical protein G4O01_03620 [Dehalococcoidia bacterium]|jgi:hypothetical protein|nr:hypothetical protein [Dehalococcoidia bacterium]